MPYSVAILGAGPAGLCLALALARRDAASAITVYDKAEDHATAPRFNPDRSYTIDITGHGVRALDYLGVTERFDKELIKFKGIRGLIPGLRRDEPWEGPGWTGSRGDICRTLMAECKEKFPGRVQFLFETEAEVEDVYRGTVAATSAAGKQVKVTRQDFDLVVACDGAGSAARRALASYPGFKQEKVHLSNYCTMVHFDQNTAELEPEWLHAFSMDPLVVAGAINGEAGPKDPRWFCMVGFDHEHSFRDAADARAHLKRTVPAILPFISDKEIEAFSRRACSHIGRAATCNTFNAERLVLVGDAGNPFPPVGQGINAALEASMVLDQCLARAESQGQDVRGAAAAFTQAWLPEARAVSWIAQRVEFGNRLKMGLVLGGILGGVSVLSDAKKATVKWSEIAEAAKRRQRLLLYGMYCALGAAALAVAFAGCSVPFPRLG